MYTFDAEERYKEVLDHFNKYFSYVGLTPNMEKDWLFLPDRFGWKVPPDTYFDDKYKMNFTKERPRVCDIPTDLQIKIQSWNQWDIKLIHYVKTNQDKINQSKISHSKSEELCIVRD